jgi:hypothetical protein
VLRFTNAKCLETTLCNTCGISTGGSSSAESTLQAQIDSIIVRLETLENWTASQHDASVSTIHMGETLSGYACGGSGQDVHSQCSAWHGDTHNKAAALAACVGCSDCHGIYRGTTNGNATTTRCTACCCYCY